MGKKRIDNIGNEEISARADVANISETSSIVYHRLIYSTQSVGAMLWSMAQLRRGQLRMVVDVVGSC